jgi:hypothetical protein
MSGIHLALLGMTYGGGVTVIQSFTATGEWVCPTGVTKVEWLIVAGGGGGGGNVAGGGGAGGFRTGTGLSVTAGTTYTITVGAGGPGSVLNADRGTNGFDSSIAGAPITENPSGAGTNTLKAYGGGGGGTYDGVGTGDGISGGSGGGGGSKQAAGTTPGGSGTPQTHLRHKEMMAAQACIFHLETFTQRGEVAVLLTPVVRQQVLLPATAATELQVLFLV